MRMTVSPTLLALSMSRFVFLVVFSCLALPLIVFTEAGIDRHAQAAEESHIVLVSEPGTPPAWAQTPSSSHPTRNVPPPEAATPGLPGPPSMPLTGLALLTLAGSALAYRRLRHT